MGSSPSSGPTTSPASCPKFFQYSPRVVPATIHIFGFSSTRSPIYSFAITTNGWIVFIQVAVVVLGTLAAAWSTWRITGRELVSISRSRAGVRFATLGLVLGCGVAAAVLYLIMHAAD